MTDSALYVSRSARSWPLVRIVTRGPRSRHRPAGFTLIELLVVMVIITILVALLMPAVQSARAAARRTGCINNLRQIALAIHNYEASQRHLPFSKRTEANGAARSWAPDILPYLEQQNIVSAANYDLDQDWWRLYTKYAEDPANPGNFIPAAESKPVANGITVQKFIEVLMCPGSPIQERTQFKSDPGVGHKIGACGDYFTPEGVHSAILKELPANLPIGSAVPGFRAGTAAADNVVVPGVLQPFGAAGLPIWVASIQGDPRVAVVTGRPPYPQIDDITDGSSNTIMIGECAGREDVWRGRVMTPANAEKGANCARARGGAWATNDNAYPIGQRIDWCSSSSSVPGKMEINNSNEWGHLYYSFHDEGAQFAFADGSVRFLSDKIPLWVLASLTTRAGGEAVSGSDF
ncbi:MAG: DUF1559 domain-containing protein [Pirellulales bacterium]